MARSDKVLQTFGQQLIKVAEKENMPLPEVVNALMAMDPTPNHQYLLWLARERVRERFLLEDSERVKEALSQYHNIKPRLPVALRNVHDLTLHGLEKLVDDVLQRGPVASAGLSQAGMDTFPVVEDSQILYNGPLGQLAVPLTYEASIALGRGTRWCTAMDSSDCFYTSYTERGPLYVWRDRNGDKFQFHFESAQFMDKHDQRLDKKTMYAFRSEHPILKRFFRDKEGEQISRGFKEGIIYCREVVGDRLPIFEEKLLAEKNPEHLYLYCLHIIDDRWPEAEEFIKKDPEFAAKYAMNIMQERWLEAESFIHKDPYATEAYEKSTFLRF